MKLNESEPLMKRRKGKQDVLKTMGLNPLWDEHSRYLITGCVGTGVEVAGAYSRLKQGTGEFCMEMISESRKP